MTGAALDIRDPSERGIDTSDPFRTIERKTLEKQTRTSNCKKQIEPALSQAFQKWDLVVYSQLRHLAGAFMKDAHQAAYLKPLRALVKNKWRWISSKKVAWRIIKKPEEGRWELEFYWNNIYFKRTSPSFVQIGFSLNEECVPSGYCLRRGSDNKTFCTNSLYEGELSRVLLCHFSRLSCGSNLEEDLKHLDSLHEKNLISTAVYIAEKRKL